MTTYTVCIHLGIIFAVVVNLHAYETNEYLDKIGYWIDLIIAKVPNAIIQIVPTHLDLMTNEFNVIRKCTNIVEKIHQHIYQCKNEVRKMSKTLTEACDGAEEDDDEELIKPVLPYSLKFLKLNDSSQIEVSGM